MQIDYVNNKFLMEFDQEIISVYDKNVSNQNQPDDSSFIQPGTIKKVTNFIKNIQNVLFNKLIEDENFTKNSEFLDIKIFEKECSKAPEQTNYTIKDLL